MTTWLNQIDLLLCLNRSPDQPLTLTNFQAQRFVLYLVSNFPPLGTVTPPSPPNPSSPIKKAIIWFGGDLPHLNKIPLILYSTYNYYMCTNSTRWSLKFYVMKILVEKDPSPSPGFKPTSFRLAPSWQGIANLTEICFSFLSHCLYLMPVLLGTLQR